MQNANKLSERLLHKDFDSLGPRERHVLSHIAKGIHISRNVRKEHEESLTFGQRLADKVAAFGGSWPFIVLFMTALLTWIAVNSYLLAAMSRSSFDPYPYILLNLVLSMLAAVQAPIIMMSQNRQAAKDRVDAAHDYEVNLKAELEIMSLHQKLDALRSEQWPEMVRIQDEQAKALAGLVEDVRVMKEAMLSPEQGRSGARK